jgi:hypothetical protein
MFNHTVEHTIRRCIVNRLVEFHPEDDEWAMGMARIAHSSSVGNERQGTYAAVWWRRLRVRIL